MILLHTPGVPGTAFYFSLPPFIDWQVFCWKTKSILILLVTWRQLWKFIVPISWKGLLVIRNWFEMSSSNGFSPAFHNLPLLSPVAEDFWFVAFKVLLGYIFLHMNGSVHPHSLTTLCSCNYKLNNNLILKYLNLIFTFHIGQYILKTAIFWWMFLILRTLI